MPTVLPATIPSQLRLVTQADVGRERFAQMHIQVMELLPCAARFGFPYHMFHGGEITTLVTNHADGAGTMSTDSTMPVRCLHEKWRDLLHYPLYVTRRLYTNVEGGPAPAPTKLLHAAFGDELIELEYPYFADHASGSLQPVTHCSSVFKALAEGLCELLVNQWQYQTLVRDVSHID